MKQRLFTITIFVFLLLGSVFAALPLRAKWLLYSATRRTNTIYGVYRPFAYRWVGAPYKEKAHPEACVPAPQDSIDRLLLNIDRIDKILGQNSRSLQLRGRAGLLACQPEESIREYKLALLLDPQSPALELELGIAFALDAETGQAIQYEGALEHTLRAGRLKCTPEFLFDAALLFQQARLPIQAEQQWNKAERQDHSSVWYDEIHQRLTAEHIALQARTQEISALSSPDSFLAANEKIQHEGDETALEGATRLWLADTRKNAEALQVLAQTLKRDHGDYWLADLMSETSRHPATYALRQLTQAVRLNSKGEHHRAARAARSAEDLFKALADPAGALRSRIELVYSLDRRAQADACLAALGDLESQALRRRYVWIAAQARLEHITCLTRTRKLDVIQSRNQAYAWVRSTGYQGLSLRSLGFLTEPYVAADSRLTLWRRDQQGLRIFWQHPLPALRGYSFYYTLADSAQKAGDVHAAVVILREGTLLLKGSGLNLIRGILLSSLGQWEMQAGLKEIADQTFSDMASEFNQLDQDEIKQVWDEAEVAHAEALIAAGRTTDGLRLLTGLTKGLTWPYQELDTNVRRVLLPALGNLFLRSGDLHNACSNFLQSISESQKNMASVHDRAQRDDALREIESSWRGLTEVELRLHRPEGALATWEAFRSERIANQQTLKLKDCESNVSPQVSVSSKNITVLVYAFLPGGLSGWSITESGIRQQWLNQSGLEEETERFFALASEPTSPAKSISEVGIKLYRTLLKPLASTLPKTGTLIIDADGELASIPWSAIERAPSHPLVESFAIAQSVGVTNALAHMSEANRALDQPLFFGPPTIHGRLKGEYAPLPEATREVESLHNLFPRSRLFLHDNASFEVLKHYGPRSSLFHFAGHAIINAGFSALLMPSSTPHSSSVQYVSADQLAELDLHRMSTVVLAACSSAAGEGAGAVNLDSLTGAFLEAGAGRVIAARWAVNSAVTADLMSAFYGYLARGDDSTAALRKAQIVVRHETGAPYYWASFQVFGEP